MRTLIVNYHYCVSPRENPYLAKTAVNPATFEQQMQNLSEFWQGTGGKEGIGIKVTFDDGTRDVWQNAVPMIKRYRIPAILFCCSLPLCEKRLLNVTKIHLLQAKLGLKAFQSRFQTALESVTEEYVFDDPERIHLGRIYRYDDDATRNFKLLLNVRLPYPLVTRLLDVIFEPEFGAQADVAKHLYMSMDEIKRVRDAGIGIGLHTHSHFMLGRLSVPEQEQEIATCTAFFKDQLELKQFELSYPYGIPGTWNIDTKSILGRHGISRAYTLGREIYDPDAHVDPLEIPRFDVKDIFTAEGNIAHSAVSSHL